MTAAVDELVDLSDLDLLDDDTVHVFCVACNPKRPGPGIAICGTRAFCRGLPIRADALDEICPDCRPHAFGNCPRCQA